VHEIVFQEYADAVTAASKRLERVEGSLRDAVAEWRLKSPEELRRFYAASKWWSPQRAPRRSAGSSGSTIRANS